MRSNNFRLPLAEYVRSQALPVDKLGHQPRLYAMTQLVGQGLAYDDDVVYAAAWLHDLGVFIGHRPEDPAELAAWDSVSYAMKEAPAALLRCGFPTTKVADVVEAIRTHQPHLRPVTLEGTILRDADILEQLGAIGILRVVAKIGRDTRYPTFTDGRGHFAQKPGGFAGQASNGQREGARSAKDCFARSFSSGAEQGSARRSFLKRDSLPKLPHNGYRGCSEVLMAVG